jgi:phosphonatase-like hydrolase
MAIKLIVFDMAGTTVEDQNEVANTFRSALSKFGYDLKLEEVNPLMGYEKKVAITKILNLLEQDREKITSELIVEIHKEFVRSMIAHYQQTPSLQALEGAEETMAALKSSGIKVGINTGFSKNIAQTIVDKLQWQEKGLIDYLVGSDEVLHGRPDPAMIIKMMDLAGITDPQEVAKVGDTEVDVREGQNAGCKFVIAVTTGAFTRAELEPYRPTHIIDQVSEVLSIIK